MPGTQVCVVSVQDGKCKMPLFLQKRSIIYPQTEVLGWRGGAWECGADPQRWESPGNSRPVSVRDHLGSLEVLPPQPLFFFNKCNQVNIIMERSLQEASFSFG